MTIRLRLTLWYSSILAITLLLFGSGLYIFLNQYIDRELKTSLVNNTEDVKSRIVILRGIDPKLSLGGRDKNTNTLYQIYMFTNDRITSRSAVLEERDLRLPIPVLVEQKLQKQQSFFEEVDMNGETLLIYHKALTVPNNGEQVLIGMIQGATPIGMFSGFLDLLGYILIFLGLLTIILASTIGWFLSRQALRPIEQVIDAANQIQNNADLERRIEYKGPTDEVGRLITTINGMLERIQTMYTELDEAYRAQRRFVADASHELRTPLTTIRGNVDLLEKMWRGKLQQAEAAHPDSEQMEMSLEAMQDIAGEAQRMSRLVSDLLALARADAGFRMELKPIELRPIVEETCRRVQFLPHSAVWEMGDLSALEGVWVQGNRDYLQQMLMIFIENAFKYTHDGRVRLEARLGDGQVGVVIDDTGIGMNKDEVPHIFERFYRADVSRGSTSGTGLGLSIAKWIIDEHGGSVEVKTRKEEGTQFAVWLPIVLAIEAE